MISTRHLPIEVWKGVAFVEILHSESLDWISNEKLVAMARKILANNYGHKNKQFWSIT